MTESTVLPEHPLRAFRRRMDWGAKMMYNRAEISNATLYDIEDWRRLPGLAVAYKILSVVRAADPTGGWTLETLFPRLPE